MCQEYGPKGQKQEMKEIWKEERLTLEVTQLAHAPPLVAHHTPRAAPPRKARLSVENGELRTESPVWLLAPVAAAGSAAATAPRGLLPSSLSRSRAAGIETQRRCWWLLLVKGGIAKHQSG